MTAGWPLVTVEEMRALEEAAFASGISEEQLQANAAAEIAEVAATMAPPGTGIVVVIGPGNNGRDAFLAGRILARRGRRVFNFLAPRHSVHAEELAMLPGPFQRAAVFGSDDDLFALERELRGATLCIDGLLGIGVRGPLRNPLDRLAGSINQAAGSSELRVLSVDVPSGIDADSGQASGEAVQAHLTVALGGVKAGCLRFPGAALAGQIEPRPIGLPPGIDAACKVRILDRDLVAPLVPTRPLNAHKASLGWVLVVGGSRDYVGAPILSASGAARSGCGLVGLAVPENVQVPASVALPEATYLLRQEPHGAVEQAAAIHKRASEFDSIALGPGLGRAEREISLVRALLDRNSNQAIQLPTVIDADALYTLSVWKEFWKALPAHCVLTPHHGEMARLTGRAVSEIAHLNWELAREYAATWGQVIVLKGSHTTVAEPNGQAWVYPSPNPGLATAGSGDVLAGLIGGLAAQGLLLADAARLAVVTHALAAKSVLERRNWRSLVASDLLPMLPEILAKLAA